MSSSPAAADVIVIGGGPGGSTAATMLARKGLRVLLFEKERFPRDHVGESLLPASLPILEELGALPAVRAEGFVEKWGATMVWGSSSEPWSWYFRETSERYPHSYQVWRPRFDQLLLENSRSAGVDVREGQRVQEVVFENGRATGVRTADAHGKAVESMAGFVVDASGQSALLGSKLGLRRWDSFFRNLAIYAYFSGAERLKPPDSGNIFIESTEHGWFWHIPLHSGWTSVGVVVDRERAQSSISEQGVDDFFRAQLTHAPRIAAMLRAAEREAGPFVIRDWSYRSERLVGDGYILVGDAACFVDPLFSSGVHLAMSSGVLAAAYVTSAARDPSLREAAAETYTELYTTQYEHFHQLAKLFYASNRSRESYFWEARRLLDGDAALAPRHAFIRAVAGQPPQGYERAVLDRGEAPSVFRENVRAVESQRAQRRSELVRLEAERDGLRNVVPRLVPDLRVERRPVLGQGEFVWGEVILCGERSDTTPCSPLVSAMLALVDGRRSLAEIEALLSEDLEPGVRGNLAAYLASATRVLYVDGLIAELCAPS